MSSSILRRNPFEVLALPLTSSSAEIRAAFRRLAKRYHPDKHPKRPAWAREKMVELVAAYRALQSPRKRILAQRSLRWTVPAKRNTVARKQKNDAQIILSHLLNHRGKQASALYHSLLARGHTLREQLPHKDYCDCTFLLAEHFQRSKSFEFGASLFEELYVCIGPKSSRAYLKPEVEDRLSQIYFHALPKLDGPEDVVRWLMKGLQILHVSASEQANAWKRIAEAQTKLGRVSQARSSLSKAIEVWPRVKGVSKLMEAIDRVSKR